LQEKVGHVEPPLSAVAAEESEVASVEAKGLPSLAYKTKKKTAPS
jgi:hypothetical protein